MLKRFSVLLTGIAMAVGSGVSAVQAETLIDSIRSALDFHPAIRSDMARRDSAAQRVKVERGALFPSVTLDGNTGYGYTNENSFSRITGDREYDSIWLHRIGITIEQLLFDGGKTINLVRSARLLSQAAEGRIDVARQNVALQAIAAYIDVRRNRELVGIAEANVQQHRRILGSVSRLAQRGRARGSDRSQAQARLSTAEANLESLRGQLEDAKARYRETVGRDAPGNLEEPPLPGEVTNVNLQESLTTAEQNNPEVGVARNQVSSRKHAYDATRGLFLPEIKLRGTASRVNDDTLDGTDNRIAVLVVATWNLYRGGSDIARRREARANLWALRNEEADTRRVVRERVRQAYASIVALRTRIGPLQTRVRSNRSVVAAYDRQFGLGQRSLLDLLDVQNDLFLSQAALANAQHTLVFNYFALLQGTGELLQILGIERPAEEPDYSRLDPDTGQVDGMEQQEQQ
jgi:adhesin transport system outer membrane protein